MTREFIVYVTLRVDMESDIPLVAEEIINEAHDCTYVVMPYSEAIEVQDVEVCDVTLHHNSNESE